MTKKHNEELLKTLNTTSKKYQSKFGASILAKYGWKEGQGLGKSEHGIKDPVTLKKADGKSGIGSTSKPDEWHNWWDDMYNKLASKIQVKDNSLKVSKKTNKKKEKQG